MRSSSHRKVVRWSRPPGGAASTTTFSYRYRYAKFVIKLILSFDYILPDDLNGFVAQRFHLLEGGRVAICYRLIKAVELGDAHMLGRIAYERNDLSVGGTQIATASLLLRCPNSLNKGLVGLSIEHFTFGHLVCFWLCLSMQPVHRRRTERDTCYECQRELGLRMHDTCPLSVEANRQAARFGRATMRRTS